MEMPTPLFAAHPLVTVNAALNATATVLLVAGYLLIKRRREIAHRNAMLAAFAVSMAFLACYLVYHIGVMQGKSTPFTGTGPVRSVYFVILISHIILAAAVPFLAAANIYLGLADKRRAHRRLARWTFPIWLYVSITGVVIYWMLYHLYAPPADTLIMRTSRAAVWLSAIGHRPSA
jgi:uncharacterized membrane protein YozB (DUF420 family)